MQNAQYFDEIAVRLQCYEPAGQTIDLSTRDLLGHTLITGGSGAGKTTRIIYPTIKQLIQQRTEKHKDLHSLVIYDTKGDGESDEFLRKASSDVKRDDDLIVITPDRGSASIDVMSDLPYNLEALDAFAGILCSAYAPKSIDTYWETTFLAILKQALRLYFFSEDESEYTSMVNFVMNYIIDGGPRSKLDVGARLMKIKKLSEDTAVIDEDSAEQIQCTHTMWLGLAEKTKSIIRSMAVPILDALNSSVVGNILTRGSSCRITDAIECGKIILVSLDAIRFSAEARLIGCLLKGQFYDTVLSRTSKGKGHRPAGIFLDDWLLSATAGPDQRYSDVTALSILRSRGGYVVAANQSLASLDLVIGEKARRAAFANFANLFFFRGRDIELDSFAAAYLGQTSVRLNDYSSRSTVDVKDQTRLIRYEREVCVPAVPVGSLARLPTGECYALVGENVYDKPLCLVPEFSHKSEEIQ